MIGVNVHIEEQCRIRVDRQNNATAIVLVFQDSVRKGQVMSYVLKGVCEKKQDMTYVDCQELSPFGFKHDLDRCRVL